MKIIQYIPILLAAISAIDSANAIDATRGGGDSVDLQKKIRYLEREIKVKQLICDLSHSVSIYSHYIVSQVWAENSQPPSKEFARINTVLCKDPDAIKVVSGPLADPNDPSKPVAIINHPSLTGHESLEVDGVRFLAEEQANRINCRPQDTFGLIAHEMFMLANGTGKFSNGIYFDGGYQVSAPFTLGYASFLANSQWTGSPQGNGYLSDLLGRHAMKKLRKTKGELGYPFPNGINPPKSTSISDILRVSFADEIWTCQKNIFSTVGGSNQNSLEACINLMGEFLISAPPFDPNLSVDAMMAADNVDSVRVNAWSRLKRFNDLAGNDIINRSSRMSLAQKADETVKDSRTPTAEMLTARAVLKALE
ncbi:MAG: hypothetical protein JWQ35_1005 [Bacteriovoracaceae bacterium]|nr:hypothetical protein [Bacteriovoracaceae bacterium]